MRKIFLIIGLISYLFAASSNDDINKKLDLLLQKINELEKKIDKKDEEINKLKKEIKQQKVEIKKQEEKTQKQFAIKSCDKLKVINFKYKYHPEVIDYYDLEITIKNTYPEEVTFIRGSLYAEDKDRVKILQDYISRSVDIKPGEIIVIKKKHIVGSELERYLKDEKPNEIKVYFEPSRVEFKNGQKLECN